MGKCPGLHLRATLGLGMKQAEQLREGPRWGVKRSKDAFLKLSAVDSYNPQNLTLG